MPEMQVTKNPYLRQRSNGSWEYFRPLSRKLAPYFDGYLNKSASAIYHVFRDGLGKPEKDKRNVLPVYLRFHAEIEERRHDAETGRLITPRVTSELKVLAEKWLAWEYPVSPSNTIVAYPPPGRRSTVALEDLAEEFRKIGADVTVHLPTHAIDRDKIAKALADKQELRSSLTHFLRRRGSILSDRQTVELEDLAAAAYREKFPFFPLSEGNEQAPPTTSPIGISSIKVNGRGLTLRDMLERWREDKKPSDKAFQERQRSVRQFHESVGILAIEQLTKDHVRQFRDALRSLPETRKIPRDLRRLFNGQRVPELVKLMEQHPQLQKQTPANATKTIGNISALLTLAVDEGFIEINPAFGVKLSDPGKSSRKRQQYDEADLDRIFRSERVDQSRVSPVERNEWFWLPLLAMLTGARLEELGQLWVDDVRQREDGVYIDINDSGDDRNPKYIKTPGSTREIPLRHELIEAGFVSYVAARRAADSVRLFPNLKYDRSSRKYTKAFSSDWSDFVHHKLGVSERKVFHSFRHAFIDATRTARLPEYVSRVLVGHTGRKDPHDNYGEGARVSTVDVEKITFTRVDLDRFFVVGDHAANSETTLLKA